MLTSVQRRHESQAEPGFDHELTIYIYIYGPVLRLSTPPSSPPNGLGPQVAAPIPFYLQAIGSISEVQLRIC